MLTRLLPSDEWPRLSETGMAPLAESLHPAMDEVIVVEDGDTIIGTWSFKIVPHVEGLWIADAHRGKPAVGRHLWTAMLKHARARGARVVMTGAIDENVKALLAHVGAEPMPAQFLLYLEGHQ